MDGLLIYETSPKRSKVYFLSIEEGKRLPIIPSAQPTCKGHSIFKLRNNSTTSKIEKKLM